MKDIVRASVRVVRPPSAGRAAPDRLEFVAQRLKELGFEVLRVGRQGISIAGDRGRYGAVFGVHVEPGQPLTRKVQAKDTALAGLVDYLEIASPPLPMP